MMMTVFLLLMSDEKKYLARNPDRGIFFQLLYQDYESVTVLL